MFPGKVCLLPASLSSHRVTIRSTWKWGGTHCGHLPGLRLDTEWLHPCSGHPLAPASGRIAGEAPALCSGGLGVPSGEGGMWPCMEGTESGTCGRPASPTVQLQGLGKSLSLCGLHCSGWAPVKVAQNPPQWLRTTAMQWLAVLQTGMESGRRPAPLSRRTGLLPLPTRATQTFLGSVTGAPILTGGASFASVSQCPLLPGTR